MSVASPSNLTVSTPSDREIVMVRMFEAPGARVYQALLDPAQLRQWLAVRGLVMTTVESDARVGGRYRFAGAKPGGPTIAWGGEVKEIVPNERIVQTEAFDGYPGEALNTTTLDEREGRTTMTIRMEYPSREIRDAVLATGMPDGAAEAYNRLQDLLRG
jgi:uncharacterized protein YndB with AHSA1/START domain